jgi:hypothetical protein
MIYELEKIISQNKTIKQVVIGCLWTWYFRENTNFIFNDMNLSSEKGMNRALQELGSSIKYLKGNGIDVYMIMNIPIGDELDPKNFYKRDFSGTIKTNVKKLTVKEFKRWSDSIGDKIKSISTQNGAYIIDPITDLSSNGICISEYERGPVHFDYTHLRADYVRNNIRYLDNIILKE